MFGELTNPPIPLILNGIKRDSLFATFLECLKLMNWIKQNFDGDSLNNSCKSISYLRCKLFCNKDYIQIIRLNYEVRIILKNEKSVIVVSLAISGVFCYLSKSKKSNYLDKTFKRH